MTNRFGVLLMAGSAMTVLMAAPAFAQPTPETGAPQSTAVQEIVVTGTSIRGVAPVGATVQTVGQDLIEKTANQTPQQILQNVPAIVGMQSAGQGGFSD